MQHFKAGVFNIYLTLQYIFYLNGVYIKLALVLCINVLCFVFQG